MSKVTEGIIKLLGIGTLSDEQKIRILERSADLIEGRLMIRLMDSLTDDKREQLGKILSDNKPGELDTFIAQEAPDFEDWLVDETNQLKTELKSLGEPEV